MDDVIGTRCLLEDTATQLRCIPMSLGIAMSSHTAHGRIVANKVFMMQRDPVEGGQRRWVHHMLVTQIQQQTLEC